MFSANSNKGFNLTFENNWTVSVQWGPRNYCDHYHSTTWPPTEVDLDGLILVDLDAPSKVEVWKATTAEVAAWNKDDIWHNFGDDEVKGYMSPKEVLEFMNMIASKEE
jgi:hypothetical protein